MRSVAALAVCLFLSGAISAAAETRVFVVANQADGYGIDRCLAKGERCGQAAAAAYCRSRAYAQATTFQKVDADEITGAVPQSESLACKSGTCDEYVAITCQR